MVALIVNETALTQAKGDLTVGSNSNDPTGRTISGQLSVGPTDGHILTVNSADVPFGVSWSAPTAVLTGTANRLSGYDALGDVESKDNIEALASGIQIDSGISKSNLTLITSDGTTLTLQANNVSPSTACTLEADVASGQNRLDSNGIIHQKHSSFTPSGGLPLTTLIAKRSGNVVEASIPSSYAVAHFVNGHTTSSNPASITLPSNTKDQIDNLVTKLTDEYSAVESSLGAGNFEAFHDSSISKLIDNCLAYCRTEDKYYVYSQVENEMVSLVTSVELEASDANRMIMRELLISSQLLGAGQAVDLTFAGSMFNLGHLMKVTTTGDAGMTAPVTARLEFYNDATFSNDAFTGFCELIVTPSQTSHIYPSITVEDTNTTKTLFVKIQNNSTTTALNASFALKGGGI